MQGANSGRVAQSVETTEAELIAFCVDIVARYKIPKQIFFVNEFPLAGSEKVMKRLVKDEIEK
jgi:fatty-acyl-CoA synthase